MAEARADVDSRYGTKLELAGAEADGGSSVLRSRLAEAEQREKAAAAALISVLAELASVRTELLPLQQRFTAAESLA